MKHFTDLLAVAEGGIGVSGAEGGDDRRHLVQ